MYLRAREVAWSILCKTLDPLNLIRTVQQQKPKTEKKVKTEDGNGQTKKTEEKNDEKEETKQNGADANGENAWKGWKRTLQSILMKVRE